MSVQAQIERLEKIERNLRSLSDDVAREGADLCAAIADRVINEGEGASGSKFSPYSTKKVPAFWYIGRSLNAGGEGKVRAAAKKRGRFLQGFQGVQQPPDGQKELLFLQRYVAQFRGAKSGKDGRRLPVGDRRENKGGAGQNRLDERAGGALHNRGGERRTETHD